MATTKIYIGDNEDLQLYENDDVIDFVFNVFQSDGSSDYDFTGITDENLKVYDRRGGKLLLTIADAGSPTGIAQTNNDITLNIDWSADMGAFDIGAYYYELVWEDSSNRPITVSFGKWIII